MNQDANIFETLKHQYKHGGMTIKLIYINVAIFLLIGIFSLLGNLSSANPLELNLFKIIKYNLFSLDTSDFFLKPWGIFTYMFSHFGLFHLLMNMLMLFFTGRMFNQFFGDQKLLSLYIVGGLAGAILEILARLIFPALANHHAQVVGASGSIMAIFMALAFYRPNMKVALFGIIQLPLIALALIFLVMDFLSINSNDSTAHFAHLGGAFIGFYFIKNQYKKNIIDRFEIFIGNIQKKFSNFSFGKKSNLKFQQGGQYQSKVRNQSDEEFNFDKTKQQDQIDKILDKISKAGYDSLTKAEKDFLFQQSKKN
ncbi:MAG: rhomboid family intramembrane serine protease [Flavobacteriaceae bacterium]